MTEHEGPDRRQNVDRRDDALLALARIASTQAAQEVAAVQTRRLVVKVFLAALLTFALLAVPLVLYVNDQRTADAVANSRYNCSQEQAVEDVFADFIRSDARLRYLLQHYSQRTQVEAAFGKIITPKLIRDLQARADRIDRLTQLHWQALASRLDVLRVANCKARIK